MMKKQVFYSITKPMGGVSGDEMYNVFLYLEPIMPYSMNSQESGTIRNIIFDLGGVLLDIHVDRVLEAFADAGVKDVQRMARLLDELKIYRRFETGFLSGEEFCSEVRRVSETNLPDSEVVRCWNLMLSGFPLHRVQLLNQLSGYYQLFLLSNTNIIHFRYFSSQFAEEYGYEMESLFTKAYYSFITGYHKPDRPAFETVLKGSNLNPEETLFIDDTEVNCAMAESCGITSLHKPSAKELTELFDNRIPGISYL
jgi:glucose-1-phosphatase